jgi:ketosteroid isomerase-like protein
MQAFAAKDLDATMEDYTEQSVLVTNGAPGPELGLAAIREMFSRVFAMFTPEMTANLNTSRLDIVGEVAYVVWSSAPAIPFASDTFVIRDGKIMIQTAAVQFAAGG